MKKDPIAIITTWYPPYNAEYIRDQAEALTTKYDVHVFYFRFSIFNRHETVAENNLTVHRISFPYFPKKTSLTMKYWVKKAAEYIIKENTKFNYKLFHAHAYLAGFVAHEAASSLQKTFYITLHNTNLLRHTYDRIVEMYMHKCLRQASRVICVGEKLFQSIQEKYDLTNIVIIPNMVDVNRFRPKARIDTDPFHFLVVGSMDKRKRLNEILQALSRLDDSVHLHVVGKIITPIEIKGIDSRITLHGPIPNSQLPNIMDKCHCLISYSVEETFGITVIEAMSNGLPVLYCASGGPEYIVPDWAGIEVKSQVDKLIQGMTDMIKQYDRFDSHKIRQYVEEKYSQESVVDQLVAVYNLPSS